MYGYDPYGDGVVGVADYDVMGEELLGDDMLGAAAGFNANALRAIRPNMLRLPPRPAWRRQIAPGVPVPGQGLWPLPLVPDANGGVFNNATSNINYTGSPQRPFEGQRLIAVVSRSAGAVGINVRIGGGGIIVGTTPQAAAIGNLPVDAFAPNAFGVRLKLDQATPGMTISLQCNVSSTVPVGETIAVDLVLLGATIRG